MPFYILVQDIFYIFIDKLGLIISPFCENDINHHIQNFTVFYYFCENS